jgi:hypothetical protein
MKKIFSFTVTKTQEVETPETTTNEAGEQVTTVKKVKKEIPYTFFIRKPNRALSDDAALFYSVSVSQGIKAGLMTIPQLEKRNANDGGLLSEDQQKQFSKLAEEFYALEKDLQKLEIKTELSEDEKTAKSDTIKKLADCRLKLNDYESLRATAYENTAEYRARNQTIVWWLLNLSYKEENGKEEPFFGVGKHEEKLTKYDEVVDSEDDFLNKVLGKFLTYVGLWATNRASTPEEFEKLESILNSNDTKIDTKTEA